MTKANWILAAVLAAPLMGSAAYAEATPAERAAEMLARAGAADAKCHYLQGGDEDALARLVARAELSLANQEPVAETKATMARGRAAGSAAACTAAEKDNVHATLEAAQHSADNIDQPEQQADAAAVAPSPMPVQKREPIIRSTWSDPNRPDAPPRMNGGDPRLAKYAMLTETYLVALRCGSRHGPDLGGLYQNIRANHDELMQSHAPAEVSDVLRRAKMRAASRGCL